MLEIEISRDLGRVEGVHAERRASLMVSSEGLPETADGRGSKSLACWE